MVTDAGSPNSSLSPSQFLQQNVNETVDHLHQQYIHFKIIKELFLNTDYNIILLLVVFSVRKK